MPSPAPSDLASVGRGLHLAFFLTNTALVGSLAGVLLALAGVCVLAALLGPETPIGAVFTVSLGWLVALFGAATVLSLVGGVYGTLAGLRAAQRPGFRFSPWRVGWPGALVEGTVGLAGGAAAGSLVVALLSDADSTLFWVTLATLSGLGGALGLMGGLYVGYSIPLTRRRAGYGVCGGVVCGVLAALAGGSAFLWTLIIVCGATGGAFTALLEEMRSARAAGALP